MSTRIEPRRCAASASAADSRLSIARDAASSCSTVIGEAFSLAVERALTPRSLLCDDPTPSAPSLQRRDDAGMVSADVKRELARRALEDVCSGREIANVADVYHQEFVDHVNAMEYRGLDGARQSVALYRELFPDLRFTVDEQVTEGDRVASRWTLTGTHHGRTVRLRGIVISRIQDGRIIEDWASSDTLDLVRQLGIRRSALLLAKHHKLLRSRPR
jgi:predicted ester cyclase